MNSLARYLLSAAISIAAVAAETTSREEAKPFYLRDIQVGDISLPFSPVTVLIVLVSTFMLGGIFNGPKSTATASHILVEGKDAEKRLEKMKKDIGKDYEKFKRLAGVHSKCPR